MPPHTFDACIQNLMNRTKLRSTRVVAHWQLKQNETVRIITEIRFSPRLHKVKFIQQQLKGSTLFLILTPGYILIYQSHCWTLNHGQHMSCTCLILPKCILMCKLLYNNQENNGTNRFFLHL